MPWEIILGAVVMYLLMASGVRQLRRPRSRSGPFPDIGQPPEDAEPVTEPRLQDLGFGTYELPLPGHNEVMDSRRG
jgi:hypothetical protein